MQSSDTASPSAGAEEVLGRERWGSAGCRSPADISTTSPTVESSRSSALKQGGQSLTAAGRRDRLFRLHAGRRTQTGSAGGGGHADRRAWS